MKRSQQRMPKTLHRNAYPSDLTDEQWALLEPLVPALSPEAAYHVHERREIVNGMLYVLRSGCPWRMLPHEFAAWATVSFYFRRWQREGIWDQILRTLRMQVRRKQGRDEEPSAAIIDSQSIKTSAVRGPEKGSDRGKKNLGTQAPCAGRYARPPPGHQSDGCREVRSGRGKSLARAIEGEVSPSQVDLGRQPLRRHVAHLGQADVGMDDSDDQGSHRSQAGTAGQ
jgi:transposase